MKTQPIKIEVETTRKVVVANKWIFFEKVREEKKAAKGRAVCLPDYAAIQTWPGSLNTRQAGTK